MPPKRKYHRDRTTSALVDGCAAKHGVSKSSVFQWRKKEDPRWTEFVAESRAGQEPMPIEPHVPRATGIEGSVRALFDAEMILRQRLAHAEQTGNTEAEMMIHKRWMETLKEARQFAKDCPDILKRAGDSVSKSVVVSYANDIAVRLRTLPKRVASVLPGDIAKEIQEKLMAEVNLVLTAAQQVQFPEE